MEKIYLAATAILLIAAIVSLLRAGLGPTWFDRILSVNSFATQTVLIIAIYCFATGHPEYIDIALLYALINYVGTIAIIHYFNRRDDMVIDRTDDNA